MKYKLWIATGNCAGADRLSKPVAHKRHRHPLAKIKSQALLKLQVEPHRSCSDMLHVGSHSESVHVNNFQLKRPCRQTLCIVKSALRKVGASRVPHQDWWLGMRQLCVEHNAVIACHSHISPWCPETAIVGHIEVAWCCCAKASITTFSAISGGLQEKGLRATKKPHSHRMTTTTDWM